jgi:sulfofructose kinase
MPTIDILGLGAVAVDDLIYVDHYPPADRKMQIAGRDRQCGGLTATALVAAARLGMRCAYAGILGEDDLSAYVTGRLSSEGIDLTYLGRRPGVHPVYSTILIDQTAGTRNIFYDRHGVIGAAEDWPPDEVIQSSRVLFVDQIGMAGMLRAARIARAAGIPVVSDVEQDSSLFSQLLAEIDHLIFSWEFVQKYSGETTPVEAARKFWTPGRAVVAITCGVEGCLYISQDHPGQPIHQPAFPVRVVDTTGCGDIFHGAYAAALVKGLAAAERFRFASAAAAIKAMSPGGQAGAPTLQELEKFLAERG